MNGPGTPARRIESGLDSLRGLAAGMVFLYHLRWKAGEPPLTAAGIDWQLVLQRFDIGVCLFFVLSGYLLSGPYWEGLRTENRPDLGRYVVRRAGRILPGYWLVLLVFGLLVPATYTLWGAIALGLQFVGLHTFVDFTYPGCVPVLWTIGIEIQFYALLPLLFWFAAVIGRQRTVPTLMVLTLIMLGADAAWRLTIDPLIGVLPGKVISGPNSPVITQSIFHFLKWFWIGMVAALISRANWARPSPLVWDAAVVAGLLGLGLALACATEGEWRQIAWWGWPFTPVTCGLIVVAVPRSWFFRSVLDSRGLVFLGCISYGLYLWHWPIQTAVFGGTLPHRLNPTAVFFVGGALSFVLTCMLAWGCYALLERPAMNWARRVSSLSAAGRSLVRYFALESRSSPIASVTASPKSQTPIAPEPSSPPNTHGLASASQLQLCERQ